MSHHDMGELMFDIEDGEVLFRRKHGDEWTMPRPLDVYDECRDVARSANEERMAYHTENFGELLDMKNRSEYLIASYLYEMDEEDDMICDWLADEFGFSRGSIAGYLSKNRLYGRLKGHSVESLGITRGYEVARACEAGHRLQDVMRDYRTMPREQWLEEYR